MEENKLIEKASYIKEVYNSVLELLLIHKGTDGICRISQSEIALRLGLSQTAIAKRFKNLRKFGAIEKVGHQNAYVVHHTNLLEHSPLGLTLKLAHLLDVRPELISDYNAQAEVLGASYNDIQIARGYLSYLTT